MGNRTVIMGGIWAEGAADVPVTPVAETTYKDSGLSESEINEGQRYSTFFESSLWNEVMYRLTTIVQLAEQNGVLPWCSDTEYPLGGLALGSDMVIYKSRVSTNEGNDPTSSPIQWTANSNFPSGTVMIFGQSSAPTGWTRKADWQDNAMLCYAASGTPASGGSANPQDTHTHTGPSHTHTGPSHTHTGPSHTHTGPSHNHQWYDRYVGGVDRSWNSGGTINTLSPGYEATFRGITIENATYQINEDCYTSLVAGTTGSGGTGATGSGGTGATGSGGTGATGSNTAPYYQEVIAATKD